jgi:hypothetical protein
LDLLLSLMLDCRNWCRIFQKLSRRRCCYDDAGKCTKRTSISATHTIFAEDFSCESVGAVVMVMAETCAASSKQGGGAQR